MQWEQTVYLVQAHQWLNSQDLNSGKHIRLKSRWSIIHLLHNVYIFYHLRHHFSKLSIIKKVWFHLVSVRIYMSNLLQMTNTNTSMTALESTVKVTRFWYPSMPTQSSTPRRISFYHHQSTLEKGVKLAKRIWKRSVLIVTAQSILNMNSKKSNHTLILEYHKSLVTSMVTVPTQ